MCNSAIKGSLKLLFQAASTPPATTTRPIAHNARFCAAVIRFNAHSSLLAALRSKQHATIRISCALWLRVYFAPLPAKCAASRACGRLLMPAYNAPLAHDNK